MRATASAALHIVATMSPLARSAVSVGAALLAMAACSDDEEGRPATVADAGVDRVVARPSVGPAPSPPSSPTGPPPDGEIDASCKVTIDTPSIVPSTHVPEGTDIAYTSNPPSSGPHYPRWAAFQEFSEPVADGYLVHSMEHGAVVLFYSCDLLPAGTCPSVVAGLRAIRDALPADPICDPSVRVRVIIVPRPKLDVPVAAAAWGWTYRAACLDEPSLAQFVRDHYGKAPENFCAQGVSAF